MPPGENLREQVWRRLANKELFLISRKGHAERGSGNSCAVCALVISSSEVQYTMPGQKSAVVAHLGCYLVWLPKLRFANGLLKMCSSRFFSKAVIFFSTSAALSKNLPSQWLIQDSASARDIVFSSAVILFILL